MQCPWLGVGKALKTVSLPKRNKGWDCFQIPAVIKKKKVLEHSQGPRATPPCAAPLEEAPCLSSSSKGSQSSPCPPRGYWAHSADSRLLCVSSAPLIHPFLQVLVCMAVCNSGSVTFVLQSLGEWQVGPTQPTPHPEPLRHPGHHQMMPECLSSRLTHMPLKPHRGLPTWRQVLHIFQAGTERDSLS